MYTKVNGEQQVQILSPNFSISPSNEDYVLNISANGRDFSPLFAVSAGVTRLVSNVAPGSYYKLVGNQSEVVINWQRMCATEGSSFDPSVLDPYWTSAETQSAITAVEDHLFDVEQVTASALTELHDGLLEVSGRTVDLSGYYTSVQTDSQIAAALTAYTPTTGFSTINGSGITDGGDLVIEGSSSSATTQLQPVDSLPYTASDGDVVSLQGSSNEPNGVYRYNGGWERINALLEPVDSLPYTASAGVVMSLQGSSNEPDGVYRYNGSWERINALLEPVDSLPYYANNGDVVSLQGSSNEPDGVYRYGSGGWELLSTQTLSPSSVFPSNPNGGDVVSIFNNLQYPDGLYVYDGTNSTWVRFLTSADTADMVSSTSVSTIWKGTQAEYDAIATKDPNTFYIIVSN